jgi:hypothetical protein
MFYDDLLFKIVEKYNLHLTSPLRIKSVSFRVMSIVHYIHKYYINLRLI